MSTLQTSPGATASPVGQTLAALLCGTLFGSGLVISGMSNPHKVLNFLALGPHWDPSLLVVMGAATLTTFIGFRLSWMRQSPMFEEKFHLPTRRDIDRPLIIGALLFGLGWGIAGYCPGPALTAVLIIPAEGLWFVGAMLCGMLTHRLLARMRRTPD